MGILLIDIGRIGDNKMKLLIAQGFKPATLADIQIQYQTPGGRAANAEVSDDADTHGATVDTASGIRMDITAMSAANTPNLITTC